MKTFIVLAALVAVALAQFECDDCEDFPDRKSRTGCRLFCFFDFFGEGVVTRESMKARLAANQDQEGGTSRARFLEVARESLGFCDDEANAAFDALAELGEGNPELIEEADIDALADAFEALSGTNALTKEIFIELYDIVYLLVGNDSCEIGF